jgi:peptidyl-prolyl cis-trans isomerase C
MVSLIDRPSQTSPSDVIVNGGRIAAADIAAEAQNHAAPRGEPGSALRAAARALAVRELLLQEARRMDLSPEPRTLGPGRRETEDEALIRTVVETRVEPTTVSEAACRAFHAANPDQFRAPTLYEAAHILLPASEDDAPARAQALSTAQVLLAELARSPDAFDRLAGSHSACSSRTAGGRLGQIVSGDTVAEFEAALDSIDVGQISSIRSRPATACTSCASTPALPEASCPMTPWRHASARCWKKLHGETPRRRSSPNWSPPPTSPVWNSARLLDAVLGSVSYRFCETGHS